MIDAPDTPPTAPSEGREFLADLRDLIRSHPAATVLVALFLTAVVAAPLITALEVSQHLTSLQHNICTVVDNASKGNAAQHQYWTQAAARATTRAAAEHGALRHLDLDSASNDTRIAQVYAPSSFTFPGCSS